MTYKNLQQHIADELCRDDLGMQIKRAIQLAIKQYESNYFTFNQASADWTCRPNQPLYSAGKGLPDDYLKLNQIALIQNQQLHWLSKTLMIDAHPRIRYVGQPHLYRANGRFIELFPVPDRVYHLSMSYVKAFPALVEDDDANPWTDEVQELIIYRSKYLILKNIIGDHDEAAEMERCAKETYSRYLAGVYEDIATGKITATTF